MQCAQHKRHAQKPPWVRARLLRQINRVHLFKLSATAKK
jgi:hypothetical protein